MAKTDFEDGTIVEPVFLDAINAHVHDGQDDDGHCAAINLGADADGVSLPEVSGRARYENLPPQRLFGYRSNGSISPYVDSLAHYVSVSQMSVMAQNAYDRGSQTLQNMIEIAAAIKKQVVNDTGDGWQSWTAGDDGGAVPSGATGWTQAIGDGVWLHVFALGQIEDYSAYDIGVDTSVTAVNLREVASDFDVYRRIGSIFIYLDTTYKIMPFYNRGNVFRYTNQSLINTVLSISSATISSTQSLVAAPIPPDVHVRAVLHAQAIVSVTCQVLYSASDYLENAGNKDLLYDIMLLEGETSKAGRQQVLSSSSQEVLLYRASTNTVDSFVVKCIGWLDDVY